MLDNTRWFDQMVIIDDWMSENIGRRGYTWRRIGRDFVNHEMSYSIRSKKKATWVSLKWG